MFLVLEMDTIIFKKSNYKSGRAGIVFGLFGLKNRSNI